jgi:hypothetical protein
MGMAMIRSEEVLVQRIAKAFRLSMIDDGAVVYRPSSIVLRTQIEYLIRCT